jgi:hypothetical protein
MIDKAIKKINPNAEFTFQAEDINTIQWLNGTTPIPVADIEAMIPTVENEIANAENEKASGKQKLKDLGLTDAEIKALTGA